MAAGITDKFLKVGVAGTLTQLAAPGHDVGGTTITLNSVTNWPTDTAVIFGMRQVDAQGELVPNTYTEWRGVISGSTLTSMVLMYGTDQVYPAGSSTQVFIPLSASNWNRLIDAILQEHDQDGTHGNINAGTINAGAITATSVTVSGTATSQGWTPLGAAPASVTPNASVPNVYDIVFNGTDLTGTISDFMKLQLARTVAAPNQCADLESSSSQYFSKSSPAGMTFTDDFTVSAWVKLESYPASGGATIVSRYNGTSGWVLKVNTLGQISMEGYNAGSGNISYAVSTNSLPLGKWIHVAAQLDMSSFTATTTTSYIMLDGIDVPTTVNRAGTNPTALVQAGNLEIGGQNGGAQPFDGKIAQVAVYSSKVTQATILAAKDRGLVGNETSLVSAWSLSNSLNDLNANANNLTGNAGAATTSADSPFGNNGASTTLEYAEVLARSFSTNTTVTVRVPAGCQLPTSGGISSVNYSTHERPYGLPVFTKILAYAELRSDFTSTMVTTEVAITGTSITVYVPANARLKLHGFGQRIVTSGATNVGLTIGEGSTYLAATDGSGGSNVNQAANIVSITNPTPGLHTYNLNIHQSGAGTMRFGAQSNQPAFFLAELE